MKLMKKAMALLLVGAMALMFAACTVPNMTGTNTNNANTNTDTGYTNAQIENLIADLDMALTALIDENSSAIVQLEEELSKKIKALEKENESDEKALADAKAEFEAKIAELDAKITECECEKDDAAVDYGDRIAALEAADAESLAAIAALRTEYEAKVAEIDAKIAELSEDREDATVDYGDRIAAIEAASSANTAAIAALRAEYEAKVVEIEARIAELSEDREDATVDYGDRIASLEAMGSANAEAIATLREEYEAKVRELEALIGSESEGGNEPGTGVGGDSSSDLDARVSELEAKITELEGEIASLQSADAANTSAIAALRAELEAEIAELDAKITECECEKEGVSVDYSTEIAALQSGVNTNTSAIAALRAEYEAKVAEIEEEIAELSEDRGSVSVDYSTEIAALQSGVNANASAIAALRAEYEAKVAEIDANIAELSEDRGSVSVDYSTEIAALQASVAENATAIATLESSYGARISALEANSSTLIEIDATLGEAGKAADAKAVGDAISEINSSVAKLTDVLESKPVYGYVYTPVDTTSEEALARQGYYLGLSGTPSSNSAYAYTQPVPVLAGDVVHVTGYYPDKPTNTLNYANKYSMRMACVYNADGAAVSSLGFSKGSGLMEFEIGEGGAAISVTYTMGSFKNGFIPVVARYTPVGETFVLKDSANSASVVTALSELATLKTDVEALKTDVAALDADKIQELSDNIVTLNAKIDALDVDKLNEAIDSIKNLDTNGMNIMVNAALGSSSIYATADKLVEGTPLELENNTIINNKNLTFTCDIPEGGLGEGLVRLGHGKTSYGASYVEITATQIMVYSYSSGPSLLATFDHGLTISDYLTVAIDADYHWADIRISTSTGYYTCAKNWQGRNGAIFAEVDGCEVTDVSMRWFSEEYQNPIWMVGDSYFNSKDGSRWTSYLVTEGYKNFLMMSYPGMASERGLTEVKQALQHGTPQYIIWCMGMNNGDSIANQTINESYLAATQEFLQICEEKGITPILSTIPSTPTVLNEIKNEWVREWARTTGGRYIDFSRAVCNETYNAALIGTTVGNTSTTSEKTNKTGYQWYDNMLHGDAVHPGTLGAQALYMQFLADFPEIMRSK